MNDWESSHSVGDTLPTPQPVLITAGTRRLHSLFRLWLWIFPSAFLILAAITFDRLATMASRRYLLMDYPEILFVATLIATIGGGYCDARLSKQPANQPGYVFQHVIIFVLWQVLLVPLLTISINALF